MGRKRKTEATAPLDELDRTIYTTFCSAANSLSHLYTQSMNQQKLAFQDGEQHAMEKLYQWILRQHEEGLRLTVADIVGRIQDEINDAGDVSMSSRVPSQTQALMQTGGQGAPGLFGQTLVGFGPRCGNSDQTKYSVFSNALSSPVRRSLQPFNLAQGGGHYPNNILTTANLGGRNQDHNQNRDGNFYCSNDSSMDIHSDTPPHESC